MKTPQIALTIVITLLLCILHPQNTPAAEDNTPQQPPLLMGTGPITGLNYPLGGAISRIFNQDNPNISTRLAVLSTSGSAENIQLIRNNQLGLAIIRSDWLYQAINSTGIYENSENLENISNIMNLQPESFTILVRGDTPANSFEDLRDLKINIGPPKNNNETTQNIGETIFQLLTEKRGWTEDNFDGYYHFSWQDQPHALCDRDVDVLILVSAHPMEVVEQATNLCNARLVPLERSLIDAATAALPYIEETNIRGQIYENNIYNIQTIGLINHLVANNNVPDEALIHLYSSLFDDLNRLYAQYPAFSSFTEAEMVKTTPLLPQNEAISNYLRHRNIEETAARQQ